MAKAPSSVKGFTGIISTRPLFLSFYQKRTATGCEIFALR
jgi:hypothetical protein